MAGPNNSSITAKKYGTSRSMKISMAVAVSENHVIGKNGQMPWHLPEDLKFFKNITMGKPVVMGRNTWNAIGRLLPGRTNIVLSSTLRQQVPGLVVLPSWQEARSFLEKEGCPAVFVIGGGKVYAELLSVTDEVYLTRVHMRIEDGDAFFPPLDPKEWALKWEEEHGPDEKHAYGFTFQRWERKAL